ncbi:DUF3857 domain-containing protein [uncultured Bacteroides sp.]|uniref:DUF3857 domain-containing protein n=1 Tax=uncultured Bacteroides sp. TaxID=162156 RepID=UPI002AAADD68|nr:DUF3857 domain-containing protein [uncultured Bacteroides sp.]
MKRIITSLLLLASSVITIYAQEFTTRYGKVTKDELDMTTYQKDTTASAVTLYKNVDVVYAYNQDKFEIEYYYETKIKILKPEGKEYANVTIPYYDNGKPGSSKEFVSRIEAYAYNMENGKIKKTKMEKNYIFDEQANANYKLIKFSIPTVKEGTVIEYKYKLTSDFYYHLPDMVIQQNIPVVYAKYDVQIPEYFRFNVETRGLEPLNREEKSTNQTFMIKNDKNEIVTVSCVDREMIFTVHDLPAIKDEPSVWCADDYRSQAIFELQGIQFPYSIYEPYSSTWDKIDEMLKNDEDFGDLLKLKNPYKEEMSTINLSALNPQEKIRTLFQLLKKKMTWNGSYKFYGNEVKKAIKNGTGSNADINFIFISMLKDAGMKAFPVMMSTRDQGRLPFTYPSINKLNTFIVGINDTDSTTVYLDGSVKNGDINILPPMLMVDRARAYNLNGKGSWVNLTNVGKHSINVLVKGTISPEGKIEGERTVSYLGELAESFRTDFKAAKDSTAYIEGKESEGGITIKECSFKNKDSFSPSAIEKFTFTKEAISNDNHIYLNPMIFPHLTKNQFIKETRKLPIEFSYPQTFKLTCVLDLPEGYQVEELPESIKINLDKEGCSCTYRIQLIDNQIQLQYIFSLKRIIYSKDEYASLRNFWGTIVDKNNEQIVLKKASSQGTTVQKQSSQL